MLWIHIGPKSALDTYWAQCGDYMPLASSTADLEATSCQTTTEVKAGKPYAQRSGGWLVACAPSGYILYLKEYYGAESLSQCYFFLAELRGVMEEFDICIHDDACHIRKFATARAAESAATQELAFPNMKYITDYMHSDGHVDEWCLQNCHPDVPVNKALLEGVNTSICEQTFRITNRFKFMVQHMHRWTAKKIVHEIAESRNDMKS